MIASWQNSIQSVDLQIDSVEKSIVRENHLQLTKQILSQKDTAVFYTDEAYDKKFKNSAASVVLYQNFKILSKSWNLGVEMNITDVEIYAIEKATEWANNLIKFSSNIWFFTDSQKSIKLIENSEHCWTTGSETSPRCSLGNGPLGLANIWSRLLKHNWWDPLYGRVCTHSDVFFGLTFNENSSLYGYINRASPKFQPMHVYGQQLWSLFHRCGLPSLFLNSWR